MDENLYILNQPNPPSKNQKNTAPRSRSRGTAENNVSFRVPTIEELSRNELHNQLYLNEVALHLIEDINVLKKEVQPMRDEIRFLIQMESNFTDTFRHNSHKKKGKKKIRTDLSSQITELTLLSDELEQIHQQVRTQYSDYSKNNLMSDIEEESKIIVLYEEDISNINTELDLQKKNLQKIENSKLKQQILENEEKITELNNLLLSLRQEEKAKIDVHQSLLNKRPALVASKSGIDKLKKKLETIQYTHSKKESEITTQKEKYNYQKNQVKIIIENKRREIQAQQRRREQSRILKENRLAERERRLKAYEENEKKIKIEKKTKNTKGNINNSKDVKRIKVSPYPNPRLFDDEKQNEKAKAIMEQNIQCLIEREIIRIPPQLEQIEQEPPKIRYHHHRRVHRKHHHSSSNSDAYIFTTSNPRYGEVRQLMRNSDNDDIDNNNENKSANDASRTEFRSTSSSSDGKNSQNSKTGKEEINKNIEGCNSESNNNVNTDTDDKNSNKYEINTGVQNDNVECNLNINDIGKKNDDEIVNNNRNDISLKINTKNENEVNDNGGTTKIDAKINNDSENSINNNDNGVTDINGEANKHADDGIGIDNKMNNYEIIDKENKDDLSKDDANVNSSHENGINDDKNKEIIDKNNSSHENGINDGKNEETIGKNNSNNYDETISKINNDDGIKINVKFNNSDDYEIKDKIDDSNESNDTKIVNNTINSNDANEIKDNADDSNENEITENINNNDIDKVEDDNENFDISHKIIDKISKITDKPNEITLENNDYNKFTNINKSDSDKIKSDIKINFNNQFEASDKSENNPFEISDRSDNNAFEISDKSNSNPFEISDRSDNNAFEISDKSNKNENETANNNFNDENNIKGNDIEENNTKSSEKEEISNTNNSISISNNKLWKPNSFLKCKFLNANILNGLNQEEAPVTKKTFDFNITSTKKKRNTFLFNRDIKIEFTEEEEEKESDKDNFF